MNKNCSYSTKDNSTQHKAGKYFLALFGKIPLTIEDIRKANLNIYTKVNQK